MRKFETLDGPTWTDRQRQVLHLLANERTNPEIAEALGISLDGAKWHVREVLTKLGVASREEAADYWRTYKQPLARGRRGLRALVIAAPVRWAAVALVAGGALVIGLWLFAGTGGHSAPDPQPALAFAIEPPAGEPYLLTVAISDGRELARTRLPLSAAVTSGQYVLLESPGVVEAMRVDGSDHHTVYTVSPGKTIIGLSPSPSGERLAVTERVETGGQDSVVILETETGTITSRIDRVDAPFDEFLGEFQHLWWHRDGHTLTIGSGGVQVSGDYEFRQSLAFVTPDGRVQVTTVDASGIVSPDGTRVLWGRPATAGCMGFVATHELSVQDLASGKVINSFVDNEHGLKPFLWVAMDRGPLFERDADAGCHPSDTSTTVWELPEAGTPVLQTTDPFEQIKAVGPHFGITVQCGTSQPGPWGEDGWSPQQNLVAGGGCRPMSGPCCLTATPDPATLEGTLFVRGRAIARIANFTLLGQVNYAPRP